VRAEPKTINIGAVSHNRYTTSRTTFSWQKSDLFLSIASCHETKSLSGGTLVPADLLPPEYRRW